MIGSLRGRLTLKQAPAIIIECNGVGYDVETPMSTFLGLPPVGDELFLFTHLVVREDAHLNLVVGKGLVSDVGHIKGDGDRIANLCQSRDNTECSQEANTTVGARQDLKVGGGFGDLFAEVFYGKSGCVFSRRIGLGIPTHRTVLELTHQNIRHRKRQHIDLLVL